MSVLGRRQHEERGAMGEEHTHILGRFFDTCSRSSVTLVDEATTW